MLAARALAGGVGHLDVRDGFDAVHLGVIGSAGFGNFSKQLLDGVVVRFTGGFQPVGALVGEQGFLGLVAKGAIHHALIGALELQGTLQLFHIHTAGAHLEHLGRVAQRLDAGGVGVFAGALGLRGLFHFIERGLGDGDELLHHIAKFAVISHLIKITLGGDQGNLRPLAQPRVKLAVGIGLHAKENLIGIDGAGQSGSHGPARQ